MMTIDVANGRLGITLTGCDRVWTVKKRLSIPLSSIKSIEIQPAPRMTWKTFRAPGAYWPGKITAGSYWSWQTKEWSFWNIRKGEKVIVIDLEGVKYSRLVLEVMDPDGEVKMVTSASE